MKRIHPEFAYQSRELGVQIEDTLGEPPDRKNYAKVVKSLIGEFAKGTEIEDVNLLSFALVEYLIFIDPGGLLAQSREYDLGDAGKTLKMVACNDEDASKALNHVFSQNPELARKAIITAFLFKNNHRWLEEDHSLDTLKKEEDAKDEDEEEFTSGQDFEHLFDSHGDENV